MNFWLRDLMQHAQGRLIDRLARWSAHSAYRQRWRAAQLLTGISFDLLRLRRGHVETALRERLGISASAAVQQARDVYQHFFLNALEMASIPYLQREELLARIEARGLDHLRAALDRGRGCIILSGHYGLWEMVPPWMSYHGFPMTVVVRRQNNPHVDEWMEFMRQAHGPKTTDSGFTLRQILRALKNGESLGLMSDQDAGTKGLFVNFLGKEASTVVGPAQIALKTGSPIVPLCLHPQHPHPHQLEICAPIFPDRYADDLEGQIRITQAYTDILAEWVRRRPEQWFWLHRRWKTRPTPQQDESPA
ncbi:MAG TPA: lysophospholipid acyltransferase family protein [Candidatus Ozemobacteraceae bacterium]|nr:lysophospholipid acyltransferase family protein [Candidatus Ozemobacteraceae bacterium]